MRTEEAEKSALVTSWRSWNNRLLGSVCSICVEGGCGVGIVGCTRTPFRICYIFIDHFEYAYATFLLNRGEGKFQHNEYVTGASINTFGFVRKYE